MKKWIKFLVFSLVTLFFLNGCNSSSNRNNEADIFQYKDSYVGDNTAVINSITQLQGADHVNGLELKTTEEPYGIIVKYDWSDAELNPQETAINNASYLFTLIQNVDWVAFDFEIGDSIEEYKLSREEIEEWYGTELDKIDNEDQLRELIQETLEEKDIVLFFN